MKKNRCLLFLFLLLNIMIISCSKNKNIDESSYEIKQTLNLSIPKYNFEFSPHKYKNEADRNLTIQLFEGLTEIANNKLIYPSLLSITHSDDFKVWTFKLRDDIFWSDGTKITAYTYKNSWLKALKTKDASEDIYKLLFIKGAENFKNKNAPKNSVKIFTNYADDELQVFLTEGIENFDEWVASPIFFPIREENENLPYDQLIVNGAFKIDSVTEDNIILSKNEKYWDKSNTLLKNINISIVNDEINAYEMFNRYETDIFGMPFYNIPYDRRQDFNLSPEKLIFPVNKYSYIRFKNKILNKPEILNLLYDVSDPEFIAEVILQDGSTSIFSHPHPTSDKLNLARGNFLDLKNKINIDFGENLLNAISNDKNITSEKILLSTAKEWITNFKLPIRIINYKSEEKNIDFELESFLVSSSNRKDFYRYLNEKFNLKNKIYSDEDFFKNMPVIPLHKLSYPILVHNDVYGLSIGYTGDLYLKYIYKK